jgi:nifR3 family TIM-barrel protein
MAEAGAVVAASGADILDINFGCSVRKIVKTGSGVALMKEPEKTEAILKAVRNAVKIPVTIKIRSGWHACGSQAMEVSKIAECCGIDAIAVHPRTATQGFRGNAERSLITKIKRQISIPVIGNGDIQTPEDAKDMMHQTGCDAVMIGRAAIGNPWIFTEVNAHLNGETMHPVDIDVRIRGMQLYLRESVKYIGEVHACRMMRSRLGWFSKGLPHSSKFRETIKQIKTESEALEVISRYEALLESDHHDEMVS